MKDAVLVSGDFVRTGGMDMPNFALALHLADCGVNVELVAHRVANDLLCQARVAFHHVPKPLNSYLLGSPLLDLAGRKVAAAVRSKGGRVLVNGGVCQVGDVNWVHYLHAAYEPRTSGPMPRRAKAVLARGLDLVRERRAIRTARVVIANSERTRRDLVERLGVEEARIHTVYYGVDPDSFSPPSEAQRSSLRKAFGWDDRPQVAFIGALGDRRKGFDTLFSTWIRLCREPSWDSNLVVVGRGAELQEWKERAAAAALSARINFLGFRSDVPDILAACDAIVSPTRYEAYGLGVHEALCTGLPAVVSAGAGVAERYPADLSDLLLHDPDSDRELESVLRNWRHNCERLRQSALLLSSELRRRTWTTMASELKTILEA